MFQGQDATLATLGKQYVSSLLFAKLNFQLMVLLSCLNDQLMLHLQLRSAGSNVVFTAVAEISDSILKGAEANGVNGMVWSFCPVLFI